MHFIVKAHLSIFIGNSWSVFRFHKIYSWKSRFWYQDCFKHPWMCSNNWIQYEKLLSFSICIHTDRTCSFFVAELICLWHKNTSNLGLCVSKGDIFDTRCQFRIISIKSKRVQHKLKSNPKFFNSNKIFLSFFL